MQAIRKTLLILVVLLPTSVCCSQDEYKLSKLSFTLEEVISDVKVPWGIVWLSDDRFLYTEREGDMYLVSEGEKTKIGNVPDVYARGQGGLMDIELHPDFDTNGWIYFSFSRDPEGGGGNTALMRARIDGNTLTDNELLFQSEPFSTRRQHFGGRIAFDGQGHVFLSLGERGDSDNAQNTSNTSGTIIRLNDDGSVPGDNPFISRDGFRPEIWSFGHRNPQGLEFNPLTGNLTETEHGPMGGDELNLILPGENYGWPVITYGKNYDGSTITEETKKAGMQQPQTYWVPSIAPSSLMFVTSAKYPEWEGDALVGSLKFNYLVLVRMDGDKVDSKHIGLENIGRIREVKEGPDGYIYVLIEQKGIFRIIPI